MNYPDYKKKVTAGLLERIKSSREFNWEGGYDPIFLASYVLENLDNLLVEVESEACKELYEALQMMWDQYCPEPYTHKFMSAGENAEIVLQKYTRFKGEEKV